MLDFRLLGGIDKVLVLLSSLLHVKCVGAHEQEVLDSLECRFHALAIIVVDDAKRNAPVFKPFAVGFSRGRSGILGCGDIGCKVG